MHTTSQTKRFHHGRNIKRFREMLGLKQEALAWELGEEWSQKRVSTLEQKEVIAAQILERVASVLKVPVEALRDFDEEKIRENLTGQHQLRPDYTESRIEPAAPCFPPDFNPLEKWVSALEENERLYERLLKSEQEKVAMLQKMLEQLI